MLSTIYRRNSYHWNRSDLNNLLTKLDNKDLSESEVVDLAQDCAWCVRFGALNHPNLPRDYVNEYPEDLLLDFSEKTGRIKSIDPKMKFNSHCFERWSMDLDPALLEYIAARSDCPESVIRTLYEKGSYSITKSILKNRRCPLWVLESIASNKADHIDLVLKNPNCTTVLAMRILEGSDTQFPLKREELMKILVRRKDYREAFLESDHMELRFNVAKFHIHVSDSEISLLLSDTNARVRNEILKNHIMVLNDNHQKYILNHVSDYDPSLLMNRDDLSNEIKAAVMLIG
jgi:hypothetical protein